MTVLNFLAFVSCLAVIGMIYPRQGWTFHTTVLAFVAGMQLPFILLALFK